MLNVIWSSQSKPRWLRSGPKTAERHRYFPSNLDNAFLINNINSLYFLFNTLKFPKGIGMSKNKGKGEILLRPIWRKNIHEAVAEDRAQRSVS